MLGGGRGGGSRAQVTFDASAQLVCSAQRTADGVLAWRLRYAGSQTNMVRAFATVTVSTKTLNP
jgi:hypothetical protein